MSVAEEPVVVDIVVFATCLLPRRILKNCVHMMWTIEYNSNNWIDELMIMLISSLLPLE